MSVEEWENPSERYLDVYKQCQNADCPLAEDSIHHCVYFARDRMAVCDHSFLQHIRFVGAQNAFAQDFFCASFMFWSYQEPYFTQDVIPCFKGT